MAQLRKHEKNLTVETCFEGVAKQIPLDFEILRTEEIDIQTIMEMEQRQAEYDARLSYAKNWYNSLDFVHRNYVNTLIEENKYSAPFG